jgi:uncharacterized protein YkwD
MLTNIFFSTINVVSNKIPIVINVLTKFFVFALFFVGTSFAQNIETSKNSSQNAIPNENSLYRQRVVSKVDLSESSETSEMERKAFDLLNGKRKDKGLDVLIWSDTVANIARIHSSNMATYKFFSHSGLDGLTVDGRADSVGFSKWRAIGENIAYNRGFDNPVEFTVERWMLSDSHRKNLLDKRWKEAGIGVSKSNDGTYYFTEVFTVR